MTAFYPIDIHSVAQSVITLVEELRELDAGSLELAYSVLRWAVEHMWDAKGLLLLSGTSLLKIENFLHKMVTGVDASGALNFFGRAYPEVFGELSD